MAAPRRRPGTTGPRRDDVHQRKSAMMDRKMFTGEKPHDHNRPIYNILTTAHFIFFSELVPLISDQNHEVRFWSLIHCVVATPTCGDVLVEDRPIAKDQSRATIRRGGLLHLPSDDG